MRTSNGHYVTFNYDNKVSPFKTTCIIKGPDKGVIVEAIVRKHHKDPCKKEVARRFAFQKALREANFDKQTRKLFWITYRQNVKA